MPLPVPFSPSQRALYTASMHTAQAGIFALGTSSHVYLEFDLVDEKQCRDLAAAAAAIREPRTTTGGVNFVIGFRPELWQKIVPERAPTGIEGFNKDIEGVEGFVMPAKGHAEGRDVKLGIPA